MTEEWLKVFKSSEELFSDLTKVAFKMNSKSYNAQGK